MSEFEHTGVIIPRFWRDFRGKSLEVKALAAFLVTGRHNVGLPGCCEVSMVAIADELEVTLGQLDGLMAQLPAGFAYYDRANRVLRVPNAPRIGHRPNHQVIRVWWRFWKALPESRLKYEHIESLRDALPQEPSDLVQKTWAETFGSVQLPQFPTGEAMGDVTGGATHGGIGGPTDPSCRPQSPLSLFPDPEKTTETVGKSTPRARAAKKSEGEGENRGAPMRQVVDAWFARYEERTGFRPTWPREKKGQIFGSLARLVGAVGADEVCRRIDILFDAPPRFLADSPPDVPTLVQHFDKLAAPAVARTAPVRQLTTRAGQPALSPNEMAERAARQLAEERGQR